MQRWPHARRKIAVVTTSRADFGLLRGLLHAIRADPALRLQLLVSGMHLAPAFGRTVTEISAEGFAIARRIDLGLTGGTERSTIRSLATGLTGFADAYAALRPDLVVLLGDRFELLAAAIPALMLRIPLAHIHGGERSEGAVDEAVRHAITKMASVHFAATAVYRRRIIQMGEDPVRVFNFGAPGLDQIHGAPLLTRPELEREIGLRLQGPVALVTFHPPTLDGGSLPAQLHALSQAIVASDVRAVFTMANADAQGARINAHFQALCAKFPQRFKWFPHLGHRRYLSCLAYFTVMIGNSSSGLTEAPSFRLPVVNIGDRQRGRVRAPNVIDVATSATAIRRGIQKACAPGFRAALAGMRNPYERFRDGSASERIKEVLKRLPLSANLLKKRFRDLV
jgi:UDP-hydrolysing UDP-N-acetyl-D-glucosamine 2-epimerase